MDNLSKKLTDIINSGAFDTFRVAKHHALPVQKIDVGVVESNYYGRVIYTQTYVLTYKVEIESDKFVPESSETKRALKALKIQLYEPLILALKSLRINSSYMESHKISEKLDEIIDSLSEVGV